MSLNLQNSESITKTIVKYELTAIAIDTRRNEMHINYVKIADDDTESDEQTYSITGPAFVSVFQDANANAGGNVARALKRAIYAHVSSILGKPGTVDD